MSMTQKLYVHSLQVMTKTLLLLTHLLTSYHHQEVPYQAQKFYHQFQVCNLNRHLQLCHHHLCVISHLLSHQTLIYKYLQLHKCKD